ncbi:MAG: glycine reductase [Clostridia bacterium]|nr:glycine reductase [Clostridia bacterium]
MAIDKIQAMIGETFLELADALESGRLGGRPKIALTGMGSEHGEENAMAAAVMAAKQGVDVYYIGSLTHEGVTTIPVKDDEEGHKVMEQLLDEKKVAGAVTMHYPFPIGVSTVGRTITPATGKEIFLATTTGTSSVDRIEGMVLNAIYGIITAKACGIENPTVGILNIDGARQVEIILKQLQQNGYPITFAESGRADGGCIMRGNDILTASCDVMVMDSLTGNAIIKMLAAFQSGGSYEAVGYGYGPGIGEGYDRLVLIVSRASGAKVLAGALTFGAELVQNDYLSISAKEFDAANKAGLKKLLADSVASRKAAPAKEAETVVAPPKEVVTASIAGIEVMDLEDAVQLLWKNGMYAESGMGCTGPIVLVSEKNLDAAKECLKKGGYIG